MQPRYDLVVLGSGNAGQSAAGLARKAGWSVLVVDDRPVGGTCAQRGCVPKKVLVAATETLDAIGRAGRQSIEVGEARIDWPALVDRERGFVEGTPDAVTGWLEGLGIDVARGQARFTGPTRLEVGGEAVDAGRVLIATGSTPRPLPFEGADQLVTSDDLLRMRELPASIVFVGAGVVSLELGHVLARAGSRVTLLEALDRPLPGREEALVDGLLDATRALGVEVRTGIQVEAVRPAGGGFEIRYRDRDGDEGRTLTADRVAHGAGRVAALDALDLAAAGVDRDPKGRLQLTAHLQSRSNEAVWAAGDAVPGSPQLSPVATYEGRIAGENLVKGTRRVPEYRTVPSAVFTVPTLAMVGETEAAARDRGAEVEVKEADMAGWISGRTHAEDVALAKVVVDAGSRQVLGAHLLGHGAPEVIHAFTFAMRYQVPVDELADGVYVYPTFHADLRSVLG